MHRFLPTTYRYYSVLMFTIRIKKKQLYTAFYFYQNTKIYCTK